MRDFFQLGWDNPVTDAFLDPEPDSPDFSSDSVWRPGRIFALRPGIPAPDAAAFDGRELTFGPDDVEGVGAAAGDSVTGAGMPAVFNDLVPLALVGAGVWLLWKYRR